MALPFFKKGKDKPATPARKPSPAPAPAAEPEHTETLMTMDMSASGIVVEENSGAPQSPVDEAAILYSSGQSDMAERLLQGVLATGDRRAWHMLFDRYCVQSREKEFEQLALNYAMRFRWATTGQVFVFLVMVVAAFGAFAYYRWDTTGQVFVFLVMVVAACEVAAGLAIFLSLFRNRETVNLDELNVMRW